MAPKDKQSILDVLESSKADFNSAISAVSEQEPTTPQPDRWNALECAEHVITVEERFLGRLEAADRLAAPRVDEQREAELFARLSNRTGRSSAPEAVRPVGRFTSLAEVADQFNAVRTRTIRFAEERGADLYSLSIEHPRFGVMNGVELLQVIAAHSRRHAEQIRETYGL